ncbi:MAG TPA: AraC family transcriptional regulator [Gemmatimonadales bacterium]|nr:AraC family transcriptional regulator [Gemmatimonadales bacterium]
MEATRLKVLAREQSEPPQVRKVLFESLGISVVDFRCRAHVAAEGDEEPNPTHSIVLVRRGMFRRTQQRESVLADANHVLLFNGAEPYRYAHPLPGGDACTILTVETHRALELVGRHAPAEAEHAERPFRRGHGLSSPRAMWLHWELLHLVARQAGRLALEDTLAELAHEAVACAYRAPVPSRRASRPAERRRRDLVEAVKLMISERLDGPPSLTELADVLGCSPYHLSHTFHATVGQSLRGYVVRLKARVAAERLVAAANRLTALALDLGYADHSHFTNSFRREWGVSPSTFRSRLVAQSTGAPR